MKKDRKIKVFEYVKNNLSKAEFIDYVLAIACIVIVLAFSYVAKYTTFNVDDFSFKNAVRNIQASEDGFVLACIRTMISFYMGWQGTWFSNIITFTLFVLDLRILHVLIASIILGHFVLIYFCIREVVLILGFERYSRWSMIVFLLMIATGMNIVTPSDNFYWIDGCLTYTIPIIFGLAGTVLYLNGLRCGHTLRTIVGAIICVFACGGPLIIAALVNMVYFGIFIYKCFIDKKVNKRLLIAFAIVLVGAFVNAAAPGNFGRQSVDSPDGVNLFRVLYYTLEFTVQTFGNYLKASYLPAICLMLIFVLAHISTNRIKAIINPFWLWGFDILIVYIMYFPYALGYNTDLFIVERVAFVVYVTASVATILVSLYTGIWMKQHFNPVIEKKNMPSVLLTIVALLCINVAIVGSGTMQIPTFVSELVSGKYKDIYTDSREIEGLIECCEDDDVIIWHHLDRSDILRGIRLEDYPEYIGNTMIADYYDKNSVILIETDD